jgi:hypothetical protein
MVLQSICDSAVIAMPGVRNLKMDIQLGIWDSIPGWRNMVLTFFTQTTSKRSVSSGPTASY